MKKTLRVLNIEDSPRDAALLQRHLTQAGYELITERVETPEAMRAALKGNTWDLILSDYSMPQFSGLQALALLREMEFDIPFILISGTVGEEIAVQAMLAGASDYMMKDNLARLVPTVERELQEAANRRARAQAETDLRASEARYRMLLETSYEGVWVTGLDRRTTYVNQRMAEMLGVEPSDMIGRPFSDFVPDISEDEAEGRWLRRNRGQKDQYDLCLRHRDGSDVWVIVSATPIFGERGEFSGSLGMLTDITERKLAERERLELSRQVEKQRVRLNNIIASIPGVVFEAWGSPDAADQAIDFVSDYVEKMLGYSVPEWLATPNFWLNIVHPDDREQAGRTAAADFGAGRLSRQQFRWITKQGKAIWVEGNSVVIKDDQGRPAGVRGVTLDITDRKQAEAELVRSEEKYRDLIENAHDIIYTHDLDGNYTSVNQAGETITGYTREESLSMNLADSVAPEFLSLAREMTARKLAGESVTAYELEIIAKDGHRVPLEVNTRVIVENGEPVGIQGIARDVTARQRAETALRESEKRYRLLFESNPLPLWVYDLETLKFLAVNDAAVAHYGYTREDFLAMTLEDIRPVEDVPALMADLAAPSMTARSPLTWHHRKKDGSIIDVEITSHELTFANRPAKLVLANDVTDRRRVEAALRESEDRYRDLVENSTDLICTHTLDGRILSVNTAALKLIGIESEEILGSDIRDLLVPEAKEGFDPYIAELRAKGVAQGTMVVHTRAGDVRVWEYSNTLRTEGAPFPIVRGMAQDVTERRAVEDALRKSEEQLRQAQKMEAIGQLAGGVAHDFNNLLTVISGYTDLTARKLRDEDPLRPNLNEIKRASERAAGLTRQLLAFSRKQVLQPRVLSLNSVVSELEKMLQRLIGEDVELRAMLEPELGQVKADPGQIEQVIMNLVVNARDAMPGGGKLTLESANVDLTEEYATSHIPVIAGSYVMLGVSDTGTGMDEATQARIFEPFFTTKPAGHGTGLGLSTVYGIVKQSGGYIWLYSEVGVGTTFKVYLPRITEDAQPYAKAVTEDEPLTGTETLLLIEDDDMLRRLSTEVLESYGYHVLNAANGGSALLLCESHPGEIQMLVTDVVMPEMNGREASERLLKLRPDMKVLFMSGYTDNTIVHQGVLDDGANFIQKPFSPEALARKVRGVLDAN